MPTPLAELQSSPLMSLTADIITITVVPLLLTLSAATPLSGTRPVSPTGLSTDLTVLASTTGACGHLGHRTDLLALCLRGAPARVTRAIDSSSASSDNSVGVPASDSHCSPNQTSEEPHLRALCPFRVYQRQVGGVNLTAAECLCPLSSCGVGGFECTPLQAEIRYRQQRRMFSESVTVACVCAAPVPDRVTAKRPPPLWVAGADRPQPQSVGRRAAPAAEDADAPVTRTVRHGHGRRRQHYWRF
ncbi:hypothetical protein FJT64_022480 [Amphibalanus amphitrite]|uniref:Uncharacterized protein n=1 Tax=Amphibalanus amphitrite TaxID=1232801 RepID=A0A6A4WUM1_AMPAM|nr:hypothetical protein FJT64_022480 [Amphibalanus amphitrite]